MRNTASDETDFNRLFEQGLALVTKGHAETAKAIFDRVLALEPCHAKALCGRGTANCSGFNKNTIRIGAVWHGLTRIPCELSAA